MEGGGDIRVQVLSPIRGRHDDLARASPPGKAFSVCINTFWTASAASRAGACSRNRTLSPSPRIVW